MCLLRLPDFPSCLQSHQQRGKTGSGKVSANNTASWSLHLPQKKFFFPPVFSSVQKPNHYYSLSNYPISAFPCTKCEQKRCAKILRPFFYTLTDMRTPNARGMPHQHRLYSPCTARRLPCARDNKDCFRFSVLEHSCVQTRLYLSTVKKQAF